MISIALYKPDIPQNTASIIRFSACYGINVHIIEPCGFNLNDSRFKRVVMDYINLVEISRYYDFQDLVKKNKNSRIILMTTKAKKSVFKFNFKKNDIILLGRESKGVPEFIHNNKKLMNMIQDIQDAEIKDGGSGAFYIFLKKKYDKKI